MAITQTAPRRLINFDFLQKLGKVLTVIAVMPAAGCDQSGQASADGGGDIAAVDHRHYDGEHRLGRHQQPARLFAVAIGGGWAKERAGGAFAAVLAFALINVITGNIFGVTSAMLADPNAVTHTLFELRSPSAATSPLCWAPLR